MNTAFVSYRPELLRSLAQLHTPTWSPDHARNARYYRWQYGERPRAARVLFAVENDDSRKVVGMRGAIGLEWKRGATRGLLWSMSDVIVRDSYRRTALGSAITQRLRASFGRETPAFVNFSPSATDETLHVELGWRVLGSCAVAHRSLSRRYHAAHAFATLDRFASVERGLPNAITVAREAYPRPMAALIRRLPRRDTIQLVRDATFYRWRYRNPLADYRFVFFAPKRQLEGFLILQVPADATCARMNVVEWEGTTETAKALVLEAAMGWGDAESLSVWSSRFTPEDLRILTRLRFNVLDEQRARSQGIHCPRVLVQPGRAPFRLDYEDLSRWQIAGAASNAF